MNIQYCVTGLVHQVGAIVFVYLSRRNRKAETTAVGLVVCLYTNLEEVRGRF